MTLEEINIVYKEQMKICASVLIYDAAGNVLLERLNKEKVGGVWIPPGGKLMLGETLRECAARETVEELGITVEIEAPVGIVEKQYGSELWTFLLYKAKIVSGTIEIKETGKIIEIAYAPLSRYESFDQIIWTKQ